MRSGEEGGNPGVVHAWSVPPVLGDGGRCHLSGAILAVLEGGVEIRKATAFHGEVALYILQRDQAGRMDFMSF